MNERSRTGFDRKAHEGRKDTELVVNAGLIRECAGAQDVYAIRACCSTIHSLPAAVRG